MKYWELDKLYVSEDGREQLLTAFKEMSEDYEESGVSLLHYAASHADAEAIKILLDRGIDVNIKNEYGETPLFALAKLDDRYTDYPEETVKECASLLFDAGASVMGRSENDGETPITMAGREGRYELIVVAIEKGVKLTRTNKKGSNVLHCACERARLASNDKIKQHYYNTVKVLVDSGFDIDEKDNYDHTAKDIAIENNCIDLSALLSGDTSDSGMQAGGLTLHQAVEKHNIEAIKAIAAGGADLNEVSDNGKWKNMTPLAVACEFLDIPSIETLLMLGADPSFVNGDDENCMARLIDKADCNEIGYKYRKEKDLCKKTLSLLFAAGLDKDGVINKEGDTLLTAAAKKARRSGDMNYDMVGVLLGSKCDVNKPNLSGQTALMLVCIQEGDGMNNLEVSLLEKNADPNLVDKQGDTALHYAAKNLSAHMACDMAEMLYEFDFDKNDAADNDGKTALEIASQKNNEPLVKMILENE